VLAYTIASEIGEITRFPSPRKLIGYTGLCPRVSQSGEHDRRGPLAKNGSAYLRWALVEAAHNARHPLFRELAAHPRARHGRRGSVIATITIVSPRRSGGCSPATSPLLRQAPEVPDRPTVLFRIVPRYSRLRERVAKRAQRSALLG
jgi:hypothetical protein